MTDLYILVGAKGRAMKEESIFDGRNVTVTPSRFIVNGQTYAIGAITSVKSFAKAPSRTGQVVAIIIGLFLLYGGISASNFMLGLFGGAIAAFGANSFYKAKAQYSVILTTASGETEALTSFDGNLINDVVTALNAAIIRRG